MTQIASFDDGTVMTMGELRGLLTNLDTAAAAAGDVANIQAFLDQWALFHKAGEYGGGG